MKLLTPPRFFLTKRAMYVLKTFSAILKVRRNTNTICQLFFFKFHALQVRRVSNSKTASWTSLDIAKGEAKGEARGEPRGEAKGEAKGYAKGYAFCAQLRCKYAVVYRYFGE